MTVEKALAGCRAAPRRFLDAGFRFKFPELRQALKDIYLWSPR